ncbi:hypothetical protein [Bradyrhizobium cosmicum]|uniref:hypothetical protein n=1 Tax=Bradyrhizobium cosmicum TaxID=1404864 RepID=UPI0028EF8C65|nr:hypothetical protein [Bradyrhizobium cosmicum]
MVSVATSEIRYVEIPHTWLIGNDRAIHEGFAVFKMGKLSRPMDLVGAICESARDAIERAEKLGDGYAAFRVFKSAKIGGQPKEMIQRGNLPVSVRL